MPDRIPPQGLVSQERWAAQIAALDASPRKPRPRKEPVTVARIVAAALDLVAAEGFDALTMRRVATALGVTPGALYAHVRDKTDLGDLMVGEVCSRVILPSPDPVRWQEQILDVCSQLREQYLQYPGISRAALEAAPRSLDTLRLNEGLLAILVGAGASVQAAAWATDAAFLYIGAYSVVARRRHTGGDFTEAEALMKAEVIGRLRMLPSDRFPITVAHAESLTSGAGHERFDSTLRRLFSGLIQHEAHHEL